MTDYYVDPDGNDGAAGTVGAPWATIAKVNGFPFLAGDTVTLYDDGVWREVLVPPIGDMTYRRSGGGAAKPRITGMDVVAGSWTQRDSGDEETGLFVEGFEGDLEQWAEFGDVTAIVAAPAPVAHGSQSLRVSTTLETDTAYLRGSWDSTLVLGASYYARFYVYIGSGQLQANATGRLFYFISDASTIRARAELRADASGSVTDLWLTAHTPSFIDFGVQTVSGVWNMDAWNWIEIRVHRHASAGGMQSWVNGTLFHNDLTRNTDAAFDLITGIYIGAQNAEMLAAGNDFFVDSIKVSGSGPIGAFAPGGAVADTYEHALAVEPSVIVMNGVLRDKGANPNALADEQWAYDNDGMVLVYKDTAGSPDTQGMAVEAGQRERAIDLVQVSDITISGLQIDGCNDNCLHADTCDRLIFEDGDALWCGGGPGRGGIHVAYSDDVILRRFTSLHHFDTQPILVWESINANVHNFSIGADHVETGVNAFLMTGNDVHSTGYNIHHGTVDMTGIFGGTTDKACLNIADLGVEANLDTTRGGYIGHLTIIGGVSAVEVSNGGPDAANPVLIEHITAIGDPTNPNNWGSVVRMPNDWAQANVTVRHCVGYDYFKGVSSEVTSDNRSNIRLLNNSFVGLRTIGIEFKGPVSGEWKNNIVRVEAGATRLVEVASVIGGQTLDSDYNDWGPEATDRFRWGVTNYSTLAAYTAASGQDANSITGDPALVDPANGDFTPPWTSPVVGAGQIVAQTGAGLGGVPPQGDIGAVQLLRGTPGGFSGFGV